MVRKISARRSDPARLHSSRHHGRVMVGDAKILPPTDKITKREAGRSTDRSRDIFSWASRGGCLIGTRRPSPLQGHWYPRSLRSTRRCCVLTIKRE